MNHTIEVSVYPEFDMEGEVPMIGASVFIGTNDEPIENKEPLEEVFSNLIEAHIIPGGTISDSDRQFLINMVKRTRRMLKEFLPYIKSIDREPNERHQTFV